MSKTILNIFSRYGTTENLSLDGLKDISVNLQGATKSDIIFYNIRNEKAWNAFYTRSKKTNAGLLIINEPVDPSKYTGQVFVLTSEEIEKIKLELCDFFYPRTDIPKLIGITGTNGKSTVVHLCSEILSKNGKSSFSIGTVGIFSNGKEIFPAPEATTPSYIDLRKILYRLKEYDFACLEVSSHGLEQERLGDLELDSIGWTNFTQDHLDFHETMDSYFEAKLKITNYCKNDLIIPFGEEDLRDRLDKRKVNYSVSSKEFSQKLPTAFSLEYNKKNLSLALKICGQYIDNLDFQEISLPKGRYNTFEYGHGIYVVDYAHTPDAIVNVVRETRRAFRNYRIITIFGCGGDRDRGKRPLMLDAALQASDTVCVTTDNPRTENPSQIIGDIVLGNEHNSKVDIVENRAEAISKYVCNYEEETIVIIAGKGHEEYQEINGVKNFFSDIEEVKTNLEKLREN